MPLTASDITNRRKGLVLSYDAYNNQRRTNPQSFTTYTETYDELVAGQKIAVNQQPTGSYICSIPVTTFQQMCASKGSSPTLSELVKTTNIQSVTIQAREAGLTVLPLWNGGIALYCGTTFLGAVDTNGNNTSLFNPNNLLMRINGYAAAPGTVTVNATGGTPKAIASNGNIYDAASGAMSISVTAGVFVIDIIDENTGLTNPTTALTLAGSAQSAGVNIQNVDASTAPTTLSSVDANGNTQLYSFSVPPSATNINVSGGALNSGQLGSILLELANNGATGGTVNLSSQSGNPTIPSSDASYLTLLSRAWTVNVGVTTSASFTNNTTIPFTTFAITLTGGSASIDWGDDTSETFTGPGPTLINKEYISNLVRTIRLSDGIGITAISVTRVGGIVFTGIDVSNMTTLTTLNASEAGGLTSLNITNCYALATLNINGTGNAVPAGTDAIGGTGTNAALIALNTYGLPTGSALLAGGTNGRPTGINAVAARTALTTSPKTWTITTNPP